MAFAKEALRAYKNCVIGDEMGLGKSIQALVTANELGAQRVGVVCPASLRINWQREADKWLVRGTCTALGYEELVNLDKRFEPPGPFDVLIVDEAHYLKSPLAQRSVAVLGVQAENRLFLSGTPIVNRPIELWTILHAIDPAAWSTYHEYGLRYCAAFPETKKVYIKGKLKYVTDWNYKGASNLVELQRRLRSTIMVRRLKKDVLKDLPAKTRQLILLPEEYTNASGDLLSAVRKIWKASVSQHSADAVHGLASVVRKDVEDRMARLRHEQALQKVPAVVAHLADLLACEHKVVVFAHHRDVVEKYQELLAAYRPVILYGGMNDKEKQKSVDTFQNNPDCRVFIGGMDAAGVGLTLTAAQTAVFAELHWVPGAISQCEDRLHRIGQKGNVLIQHIVLNKSLDAVMAKVLMRKQLILDKVLDGDSPDTEPFDWLTELAKEAA